MLQYHLQTHLRLRELRADNQPVKRRKIRSSHTFYIILIFFTSDETLNTYRNRSNLLSCNVTKCHHVISNHQTRQQPLHRHVYSRCTRNHNRTFQRYTDTEAIFLPQNVHIKLYFSTLPATRNFISSNSSVKL